MMKAETATTVDRAGSARIDEFFSTAADRPAFLKAGIYGDPSTGKSYTASLIACGLSQRIGKPPVLFVDTETGSDWVGHIFEAAGIAFRPKKTRAFTDLLKAVSVAEQMGGILIIDSVTHFWEEIREAYLVAKRRRTGNPNVRLELPDWNAIKPAWGKFTAAFLNAQCHIILCGRGASIYEFQEREEDGKKEMITAGTRMAAEKGLGYEPSLLIEMTARQVVGPRKAKTIIRMATVIKDRADVLDGAQFDDPTFGNFLPHIERLNIGGTYRGIDISRTSEGLFPTEGAGRDAYSARRLVVLDDTKDLLLKHIPGQSVADKQRKTDLFRKHFGCGWVEAEELAPLEQLKAGYIGLKRDLEPEPQTVAPGEPVDEIPFLEPKATATEPTAAAQERAPAPAEAAPAPTTGTPINRMLTADLEASTVVLLEKAMAKLPNEARVSATWKDYERLLKSMSPEATARMLAAREAALERCAAAKARLAKTNGAGREAAIAAADAEAAREAAQ
jgi:hypothetical protein